MKTAIFKTLNFTVALLIGGAAASVCFAGTAMKWNDVPEAVRRTILANGGKAGSVDREGHKIKGMAVYEAEVKNKKGEVGDLVVTEDGTLVTVKHDDAADRAQEQSARTAKVLDGVKFTHLPEIKRPLMFTFSHPRDITNPFVPLSLLKQDVLEGTEDGKQIRITRTVMPGKHRSFTIAGQKVDALVVEDREFEDGALAEVAIDYFAQADDGTVFYLGEEVDEYEGGKLKGHKGSWMFGKDTQNPGVLFPAHPTVGARFKSEDVSKDINEQDEVVSVSKTVMTPAGTYKNCVKVREKLADGTTECKYYAPGVGVVREVPPHGDVLLKSHATRAAK